MSVSSETASQDRSTTLLTLPTPWPEQAPILNLTARMDLSSQYVGFLNAKPRSRTQRVSTKLQVHARRGQHGYKQTRA